MRVISNLPSYRKASVFGLLLLITCTHVARGQPVPSPETFYKQEALQLERFRARPPVSQDDMSFDVTYYKLDLRITTAPDRLEGRVTVKGASRDSTLSFITLDLMNAMTVDSVTMESGRVSFMQHPATLVVTLDTAYGAGQPISFDVYYGGVPHSTGFGSFVFSSHGDAPFVWSLSEPYGARDWWPCKNHPLDKADSLDVWVTCAQSVKVGSNGRLIEVRDNGDGTHTWMWAHRYPIASYLVSIAVANYVEFSDWFRYSSTDSMEVLNYVLPEHLPTAQAILPLAVDMLGIFSDLFGLYPFINEKYGHAQFGWGGAMEHQTMTSISGIAEFIVAHELAHQWFGNMITCRSWSHIWMNEGFATYAEALYFEQMYGHGRYAEAMRAKLTAAKTAKGPVHIDDTTSLSTLFNNVRVYQKGAAVLHMLRHVVGDSSFFAALKAFSLDPRFRFGSATTEDFCQVCENVTGKDLGYFFQQWIYGESYPHYFYSWVVTEEAIGYGVNVHVNQTTEAQTPLFFAMPIDFRIAGEGWDTTVVVFNTRNGENFIFQVPARPTQVELDPERWILRDATEVPRDGLPPGFPHSLLLQQNYPNPFNPRTKIIYGIPSRAYVSLTVFDLSGKRVRSVVSDEQDPSYYRVEWDGLDDRGSTAASGVYFCRLTAGNLSTSRKLLLIR